MRYFLFLLLLSLNASAQEVLPAIGSWREHLPYHSIIDVTASANKIYAATPFSIFRVDLTTKETDRLSKITGLAETGISKIEFDKLANKLFIAYTNSNVDIIDDKGIHNVPDLERENIAGDKSVYHIFSSGDKAYLSTGFGIWVLNATKFETSDTWLVGDSGKHVHVNMFSKDDKFFYAATKDGLKRASVTTANPADFNQWQTLTGTNGLPAGEAKGVIHSGNKIISWVNDTLFVLTAIGWQPFFANGSPFVSLTATSGKITITQSFVLGGPNRVIVLDNNGVVERSIEGIPEISYPAKAILVGSDIWVADVYKGLSQHTTSAVHLFTINSPQGTATGEMLFYKNTFYAAAGSVNEAWNYQYNRNGVYRYREGNWTNFNQFNFPQLDSLMDMITVSVDPRDESVWAGSYGGGLLHIKNNNTLEIYKQNSPLQAAIGDASSYRVSGLAFDSRNNLWISNYGAPKYFHVIQSNGSWQSFSAPFFLVENAVAQILIDDADQKWIVSPKSNGLIVFNHGSSIENTADDNWRILRSGAGNGNLPAGDVNTITKDKSGFIWVGTTDGIGIIQCPESVFTSSCQAVLPIVQQGAFANYLFKGDDVRSISVDGADRKWVATKNGAWLISADGDRLLAHFTKENSPLLSNDVKRIAINDVTGEVFFATANGIISFRGTATEGAESSSDLLIFPNPVLPGYNGSIAIKGLTANSFVKITELNGRLVYQQRATGGQMVWNGKDYKGNKIASGVYLVLVTDENKQEKAAGKIVFIAR